MVPSLVPVQFTRLLPHRCPISSLSYLFLVLHNLCSISVFLLMYHPCILSSLSYLILVLSHPWPFFFPFFPFSSISHLTPAISHRCPFSWSKLSFSFPSYSIPILLNYVVSSHCFIIHRCPIGSLPYFIHVLHIPVCSHLCPISPLFYFVPVLSTLDSISPMSHLT